jgi:hypothetical protein
VGNRLSETIGGNTYTYGYASNSNRLASVRGPTAKTYSYDNMGNLIGDGARSFEYDDRGRLKQATVGSTAHVYEINGLGQRVTKADAALRAAAGSSPMTRRGVCWANTSPMATSSRSSCIWGTCRCW